MYLLIMSLTHIDLHAGTAEIPQSEGRVLGRGDHQSLGVVGPYVSQLLVMTYMYMLFTLIDIQCTCAINRIHKLNVI